MRRSGLVVFALLVAGCSRDAIWRGAAAAALAVAATAASHAIESAADRGSGAAPGALEAEASSDLVLVPRRGRTVRAVRRYECNRSAHFDLFCYEGGPECYFETPEGRVYAPTPRGAPPLVLLDWCADPPSRLR